MDNSIHNWKMKKMILWLSEATGNGTSMISLVIPSNGKLHLINKMLTEEYGTAKNIKSRVNRLSVLSAITTTQHKLKLYKTIPPNGLIIYSGTMLMEDGKEKKVNIDFEPFKPIHKSLYLCDNKFLEKRSDDKKQIIVERFKTYKIESMPVLDFYRNENLLHEIDGMADIHDIYKEIRVIIDSLDTWLYTL